jgi:hypothetical protein
MRDPCKPNLIALDLPELDGCSVRSIGMRERQALAKDLDKMDGDLEMGIHIFSLLVVDENLEQVWDSDSWDVWSGKYRDDFEKLLGVVLDACGFGVDKAKKS